MCGVYRVVCIEGRRKCVVCIHVGWEKGRGSVWCVQGECVVCIGGWEQKHGNKTRAHFAEHC